MVLAGRWGSLPRDRARARQKDRFVVFGPATKARIVGVEGTARARRFLLCATRALDHADGVLVEARRHLTEARSRAAQLCGWREG